MFEFQFAKQILVKVKDYSLNALMNWVLIIVILSLPSLDT